MEGKGGATYWVGKSRDEEKQQWTRRWLEAIPKDFHLDLERDRRMGGGTRIKKKKKTR